MPTMNLSTPGAFCFLDTVPGAELSPLVRKVERLGYSVLWYVEGTGRESLSLGTYLLSQTERLVVASGIAVAFCREPIAAANAARALSELFPGRFILGLGVSNTAANARRGVRYESPPVFMREYLARMRAAPYEAPAPEAEAPVVLGSLHPKMIALARDETAGVLTYFTPPEKTAQIRAALGPGPWLCAEQAVRLDSDRARARAAARAYMSSYLRIPHYATMLATVGLSQSDFANGGSDRLVDAIVAWGSEDALRQRLDGHRQAGATHVCVLPLGPDGSLRPDERVLEALAPRQ
jgi:probable F420-dependent oxidoreductase